MLRVILEIPKISIDSKFEFMKRHLQAQAFSKAWAHLSSILSLQAPPQNERPTGSPEMNPKGTLIPG